MIPNEYLQHQLVTSDLGVCQVFISPNWPRNYGVGLLRPGIGSSVLVRIQSRCAYSESLGSLHCDCALQLSESKRRIRQSDLPAIIFYLEQEGRGAGIEVKAGAYRAYDEQRTDTFEYYRSVNLSEDLRDFDPVAQSLVAMEVDQVILLTNNPKKVDALETRQLSVIRDPLTTRFADVASDYMEAKRGAGHIL